MIGTFFELFLTYLRNGLSAWTIVICRTKNTITRKWVSLSLGSQITEHLPQDEKISFYKNPLWLDGKVEKTLVMANLLDQTWMLRNKQLAQFFYGLNLPWRVPFHFCVSKIESGSFQNKGIIMTSFLIICAWTFSVDCWFQPCASSLIASTFFAIKKWHNWRVSYETVYTCNISFKTTRINCSKT